MSTQKTNTPPPLENEGEKSDLKPKPDPAARTARRGAVPGRKQSPPRIPPLSEIADFLSYHPETGNLHWIKTPHARIKKGAVAGYLAESGYRMIGLRRQLFYSHRLAWLLHYGSHAESQIDHINRDKSDNRICNLRSASAFNNHQNIGMMSTNTSGRKGATFHKATNKWRAAIKANGKTHWLGTFPDRDSAAAAYAEASLRLHGEFGGPLSNDGASDGASF